jgi:hypothetical protein
VKPRVLVSRNAEIRDEFIVAYLHSLLPAENENRLAVFAIASSRTARRCR